MLTARVTAPSSIEEGQPLNAGQFDEHGPVEPPVAVLAAGLGREQARVQGVGSLPVTRMSPTNRGTASAAAPAAATVRPRWPADVRTIF